MGCSPQWKVSLPGFWYHFTGSASQGACKLDKRKDKDPSKVTQQRGQKKPGNPQTVLKNLFLRNSSHTDLLSKAPHFHCIILNNKKTTKNQIQIKLQILLIVWD